MSATGLCWSSSGIPSYNFCATCMVFFTENPKRLYAVCCNVLVIKGGNGFLLRVLSSTDWMVYVCFVRSATILSVVFLSFASNFFLPIWVSAAIKEAALCLKVPSMVQYSSGLKLRIASSRSTIRRNATDCTRPAERPAAIFFHKMGDTS